MFLNRQRGAYDEMRYPSIMPHGGSWDARQEGDEHDFWTWGKDEYGYWDFDDYHLEIYGA